jgi:hypothetical protein
MRLPLPSGLAALVLASAAGGQGLTEEEFLAAFTPESAAVRALTEGEVRAAAERRRAGVPANPRLDFWREQPEQNPRVTNWTLSWTPPLDGRYGLGKRSADAGLAAARARLAADKAALRRESARGLRRLEPQRRAQPGAHATPGARRRPRGDGAAACAGG